MVPSKLKNSVAEILRQADVIVDGDRPWDVRVKNDRAYLKLLGGGSLGLGESYMAGDWECDRIDIAVDKIYRANLAQYITRNPRFILQAASAKLKNYGSKKEAFQVGEQHYDLGNDLYKAMLDSRMIYSCAYWKNAKNLEEAQEAKLDLICKKLHLKPGMTMLDIGGGWGGLAKFAAEKYGVTCTIVSVSKEQMKLAAELCKGLPVECKVQDYRDVTGLYDRVVSVGMFEHVSPKYYRTYMEVVKRCLKDDGLSLLHTIASKITDLNVDPWVHKYIFPNSVLPSLKLIAESSEKLFIIEDVHNFGPDYDTTLMAWYENFEKSWKGPLAEKYGETFYRMWRLYLLMCAGSFRSSELELYQVVLAPIGRTGTYQAVR